MDGIKHSGRFAEMERLVNDYFNCHIAPIMSKTRTDLIRNQGEEMKEYSTSLGGYSQYDGIFGTTNERPLSSTQGHRRMELQNNRGLYRDVQDGDYRFRGNAARPCGPGSGGIPSCRKSEGHVTMSCQNSSVVTSPMPIWTTE